VTGLWFDERGQIPGRSKRSLSLYHHIIHTLALEPTQYAVDWVLESLSPEAKGMHHEADHLSPCSTEAGNAWSYTSTLWYVFTVQCLIRQQNNFTLLIRKKYVLKINT
jgi:hypothetical protein